MSRTGSRADAGGQGTEAGASAELQGLLSVVLRIPIAWAMAMVVLAVLSCVDVSHPSSGGTKVDFEVTGITVGVLALIWLPALLRLLALTGGRLKAAGIEASSGGLLGSPEELIDRLASIRTVTERVEREAPGASASLREVEVEVDQIASEYLGGAGTVNRSAIRSLARAYEQVRAELPPGDRRTSRMTLIVNEARVRASANPTQAEELTVALLRSRSEGERIVGLAFAQAALTTSALLDVLELVRGSATAFEMFHALLALGRLAPRLDSEQRRRAREVLIAERQDPRGVGIDLDPHLPGLMDDVIGALGG